MAESDDLLCNFRRCRKRVAKYGWVTSCSHIFCDEDGTREFRKGTFCPACEADLQGRYDVVRVELQPSEQYKSMVLAGQRPETIMEIASRALSFWTYQASQERTYQEYVASKSKEKISQMEQYYDQMISKAQNEITSSKNQISVKTDELEDIKRRLNETSEKLEEKNRQYAKLQGMYDSLRRKVITPNLMLEREERRPVDSKTVRSFMLETTGPADILRNPSITTNTDPVIPVQSQREFSIQHRLPAERPLIGGDSRHGTPIATCSTNHQVQESFTVNFVGTPGLGRRTFHKK